MVSNHTQRVAEARRREHLNAARREQERAQARRRTRRVAWAAGMAVVIIAVAAMLFTSRSTSTSATRPAPDFTLPTTAGATVTLSDYRGRNVLLYFSEGAGCQSCLVQMAQLEKDEAAFDRAGLTVLPIVMNTKDQITADMRANGVTTPFLLDDGTVSKAYDTLGKGMHAGLPGHSFVLVDGTGTQRWHGDYPSMWLAPADLLKEVDRALNA